MFGMQLTPKRLQLILNLYPPYLGAGIKITHIGCDWRELHVSMALRWFNRNAVGTHFGGSLYSMIDPHLMLLLMQLMGNDYIVWDKAAEIEFVKASKGRVTAVIKVSANDLELIRANTDNGDKYFARFTIDIMNAAGERVATAKKTIYIRRRDGQQLRQAVQKL